mgnify:CR=1 FL=1
MALLFEGIKVGLVLCFMAGPIFFTLLQTGVEEGLRAGTVVGLGIWISDLIYINLVYWSLSAVRRVMADESFTIIVGSIGGALLILFGLAALLVQPKNLFVGDPQQYQRSSSYLSLWLKGFLINSVNPFTMFFWMGLMSTVILRNDLQGPEASVFFLGLMGTVVVTDFTKVALAKRIRTLLKPVYLIFFRKIAGAALILFGLALLIRITML